MLSMSNARKYVLDSTQKATTIGIDAQEFWTQNKAFVIGPTVLNVLGIVGMILLYGMGK
jgi:hypothetical protein